MRPRSPLHDAGFLNITRESAVRISREVNAVPDAATDLAQPDSNKHQRLRITHVTLLSCRRSPDSWPKFSFCKGVAKADPKAVFRLSARTDCFIKCVSSFKPLFDSGFRTACRASVRRPWMLAGPPRHYPAGSTIHTPPTLVPTQRPEDRRYECTHTRCPQENNTILRRKKRRATGAIYMSCKTPSKSTIILFLVYTS